MKYIVMKDENGTESIFIFPRTIDHDAMAESLQAIRNQTWGDWKRIFRTPVSAGFIENGICYGRSESLDLDSRREDAFLLYEHKKNL